MSDPTLMTHDDAAGRRERERGFTPNGRVAPDGEVQVGPACERQPDQNQIWAVVVARIDGAKSRLAAVLGQQERRELALSMLDAVLAASAAARLAGVLAVVDAEAAAQVGRKRGVEVLLQQPRGMNAAVAAAIEFVLKRGAAAAIVLPGDVPLVCPADLAALVDAADNARRAVVVGASRDGTGTNALLLRPPDVIAPSFGPPSVERHLAAGRAAGAFSQRIDGLQLALDVDTPRDLETFHQHLLARGQISAR